MKGGWPDGLDDEIAAQVIKLEKAMGRKLGDAADPLLVSVRSGAKFSMPGMMDTVLNLGLNDSSVKGLAAVTGDERFAYDSYRRFISMYGRIVLGIDGEHFEHPLEAAKAAAKVAKTDAELSAKALKELCEHYKTGRQGPTRASRSRRIPRKQLRGAVEAVFASWNGARAIAYRVRERISHDLGTAVNVQSDGVRQPRREQRHRRGLHPQRGHRREQAVRRLPDQRPGRGRGGRHPQHRRPRPPEGATSRRSTPSCSTSSTGSSATTPTCATPSSPSSRASSGCCRPVSASAPAPPR